MTLSVMVYGQTLIVQSNNADDLKQYQSFAEKTNINSMQKKLENIVKSNPDYSNSKIKIQIIFFDPLALGGLKLKSNHTHSSDYVNVWKTTYADEDRILFFFEKQNGKYQLKDFVVSQNIENGQIPDIVTTYIKKEILMPKKDDHEDVVYKGLNAIKNAYDRRFQQKLIEHAPKMLECRYYYKWYTCIETYSCYFQNSTTQRTQDLNSTLMYLDSQGKYQDVYLKNWNNVRATIFNILIGHELIMNTGSIDQSRLFIMDGTSYKNIDYLGFSFDTKDLFDYSLTEFTSFESVSQQAEFKFVETLKNSKNIMTMDLGKRQQLKPLLENGKTIPVSHTTSYKLVKETIHGPTITNLYNAEDNAQVTMITDEHIWGHPFWTGFQTWCNVYAQYLSRHIYGKHVAFGDGDDFLVPSKGGTMSANKLFDFFDKSPHYIDLKEEGYTSDEIWVKLINKGYSVYFSRKNPNPNKSGHIETGFPETPQVDGKYNRQKFENPQNTGGALGSDKFAVGAGSTVGFKSYDQYDWIKYKDTKAFLALKYLEIEY